MPTGTLFGKQAALPGWAAEIMPIAAFAQATGYVVRFVGAVDGVPEVRTRRFGTAAVALIAARPEASRGASMRFAIAGLDPSERYSWCSSIAALLGDMRYDAAVGIVAAAVFRQI